MPRWIGLWFAYSTASLDLRFNLSLVKLHFIVFLVPLGVLSNNGNYKNKHLNAKDLPNIAEVCLCVPYYLGL